jgi:hypothetical protein
VAAQAPGIAQAQATPHVSLVAVSGMFTVQAQATTQQAYIKKWLSDKISKGIYPHNFFRDPYTEVFDI